MLSRLFMALCGVLTLVFLAVSLDTADAARIGGGRSFGGRPAMTRPAAPPSSTVNRQQAATQQGQAAAMPRQGLFGGMGGMLGGLLAGGLIGSMLFGGGMGGGMGGLLDIVLIGGLLYLLFKFLGRRRAASAGAGLGAQRTAEATAGPGGSYTQYQARPSPETSKGGMSWDALSSAPASSPAASGVQAQEDTRNIPAGFDENEFLDGAKAAYVRLNTAWDKRDLDDVARFATPAFMDEIKAQAEQDPTPGKTEIMLVNASLVEVKQDGDDQLATVFFNVVLREEASQSAPTDVREMWHFVRNADGTGQWRLDGIQQVM